MSDILNKIPLNEVLQKVIGAKPNINNNPNQWQLPSGEHILVDNSQSHWICPEYYVENKGAISLMKFWTHIEPGFNAMNANQKAHFIVGQLEMISAPYTEIEDMLNRVEEIRKNVMKGNSSLPSKNKF